MNFVDDHSMTMTCRSVKSSMTGFSNVYSTRGSVKKDDPVLF